MRISELLSLQAIDVNASVASKAETIDYMTRLMEKSGNLNDREAYKKGVLAREEEGTTGIGEGIAIPHSKCAAVKRAGLAACVRPLRRHRLDYPKRKRWGSVQCGRTQRTDKSGSCKNGFESVE